MNHLLFATIFLAGATEPVGVPVIVPIVIVVILALLFWWGLNRNTIPQTSEILHEADGHQPDDHGPEIRHEPHGAHHEPHEPQVAHHELAQTKSVNVPLEVATEPDDLKKVEGIGPKIEGLLHDAGVRTFADLAAATVGHLEKIVKEDGGIRVAFPDTWPEQAALAAANEWAKLEQLQDELTGGRRL